jgi:glycosyltransferase involved in cell wall biosynthesis
VSRRAVAATTARALLLTPSCGLGGGIERYTETIEWAFAQQGVSYQRLDLRRPGAAAHARLLADARALLRGRAGPTRLVLAHCHLLPVAALLARQPQVRGITVLCHGTDVWGNRLAPRWHVLKRLMRGPEVRVVAVSSFTSGALSGGVAATILPPGLSGSWFDTLVAASAAPPPARAGVHLVTAFRMPDWRDKGLPQLLDAVAALGRPDVRVTVCGSGVAPAELRRLVAGHERCELRCDLSDRDLARQFAAADLFVLATRTRPGRHPSGEGFGLVLLEAQVAGTPVIAPAYGGCHDAFLDRVTGMAPADESVHALAGVLDEMLSDSGRLAQMADAARRWARACYAPERYAARAVANLL